MSHNNDHLKKCAYLAQQLEQADIRNHRPLAEISWLLFSLFKRGLMSSAVFTVPEGATGVV